MTFRKTKFVKEGIRQLASAEKSPSIIDVLEKFNPITDEKAELLLKSIKILRKKFAKGLDKDFGKIKGVQQKIDEGHIYLVSSELLPGWIKAGMTTNLTIRLKHYNCCDPLKRYKIVSSKKVEFRRKAEKILLYDLKIVATDSVGEWFKISESKAVEIFKSY